jgi:glycosyltransferase involved in cell wall biosynthesis
LRLGINGVFNKYPATGIGRYILALQDHIAAVRPDIDIVILNPTNLGWGPWPIEPHKPFKEGLWELLGLSLASLQLKLDALHCPNWACPLFPTVPTVVTIPDIVPVLPMSGFEVYRASLLARLYYMAVTIAARRCKRVITLSEKAAQDCSSYLHIPMGRFLVVPIPPNEQFIPITNSDVLSGVRSKYHLPDQFILSMVGQFDYRRNLQKLIEAFSGVARKEADVQLILVGDTRFLGNRASVDPRPIIAAHGLESSVRILGLIDEQSLPAVYSAATILVCPSLYEGYGLPVLEAMACGTPIIASDNSALPQTTNGIGLFVDPNNGESISNAMLDLLRNPSERSRLSTEGINWAKQFSWNRTASKTVEIFENLML